MFIASVEARNGDRLNVQNTENQVVGGMLINLLAELDNYCSGDPNSQWVKMLEPFFDRKLCETVQPLISTYYSGNWDYLEDEYQVFIKRMGEVPITEEEFKKGVREIRSMWANINTLHDIAARLLIVFQEARFDPVVPFYEPPHTENELKALLETLQLLIDRGVEEARIAFV